MAINLNIAPYYDDYNEAKGFHKILLVPSRPLQSRELTQIQDILQTQIKRGGDFLFKNGSIVIPGNILYRNDVKYVKLDADNAGISADSFIDSVVNKVVYTKNSDGSTIVAAQVIQASKSENNDPPTLFLQYTKAGDVKSSTGATTGYANQFSAGDVLYIEGSPEISFKVSSDSSNTGSSSLAFISEGVFYINGYYVQCLAQSLVIGKYDNTPTVKVGLAVDESIITEADDSSLYDGAHGFSNYGAPGAHRLKIALTLTKEQLLYGEDEVESDENLKFIDLLHVKNGVVVFENHKTQLNELEKIIAERTYDESGDYIVEDFKQTVRENKTNKRGVWTKDVPYVEGDITTFTFGADSEYVGKTISLIATSSGIAGGAKPTALAGVHFDGGVYWVAGVSVGVAAKYNDGLAVIQDSAPLEDHIAASEQGVIEVSSGKAYVKGYQVETLGKTFVKFNKARSVKYIENAPVVASEGSFILIKNMNGLPDINTLQLVDIKDIDGAVIGKLRVRSIDVEHYSDIKTETIYRLQIIGVEMNAGKLFSLSARSISSESFNAQIVAEESLINYGSVYADGSTTLYGRGTLFQSEFDIGQQIKVNDIVYSIVSIESDIRATVNTVIPTILSQNATGCYKISPKTYGGVSLLTKLPHDYIRSTRMKDDVTVAHQYSVRRRFTKQNDAGSVVVSLQHPDEIFTSTDTKTYICALLSAPYTVVYPSSVSLSPDAKSATLSFTGGSTASNLVGYSGDIEIISTVQKTNSATREKQKIRKVKSLVVNTMNGVNAEKIMLGEADAFKLLSVKVSGGSSFSSSTPSVAVEYNAQGEYDATEKFALHTGQTPSEYGLSYVTFSSKFDANPPSKPIKITFEYYDHTPGDYFSVNSYLNTAYKDIPTFTNDNGGILNLRDYLDFRPRVSDDGLSFDGAGGSVSEPLSTSSILSVDYSYYLPRHDVVYLTNSGELKVAEGVASDYPVAPSTPSNAIALFDVILQPYTAIASYEYVKVQQRKNQRYTMKDIADLDNRISNLEYYTTLSLLQKSTNDLIIKDNLGYDRFKNGFVVDEFAAHGIGEIQNNDYLCAVDPDAKELRPSFTSQTVSMVESKSTNREANSYVVKGSVALLPYEEVPVLQQRKGSIAMDVNPFMSYKFEGGIKIYPDNDFWVNHTNLPSQNITVGNDNAASIAMLAQRANIVGTTYGAWAEYSRSLIGTSTNVRSSTTNSEVLIQSQGDTYSGITNTYNNVATTVTTTTVTNNYNVVDARRNTTVSANKTANIAGSIDAVSSIDLTPYMRTRHLVTIIRGLKPNAQISGFMNNVPLSRFTYNLNRFVVNSEIDVQKVITYEKGSIRTENPEYRVWGGFVSDIGEYVDAFGRISQFNRNLWNQSTQTVGNNNTFDRGEAVRFSATDYTNGGQSINGKCGVVVAIEKENIDGELKTVLYVANDLCNPEFFRFTNMKLSLLSSNQTVDVTYIGRESTVKTNSLGNAYVLVEVPNRDGQHIKSGTAEIVFYEIGQDTTISTSYKSYGTDYNKKMTNIYDTALTIDTQIWTEYRNRSVSQSTSSTVSTSRVTGTFNEYTPPTMYYGGGDGGGGSGGCFLTTAAVYKMGMEDDCAELTAARFLRDVVMKDSDWAKLYFKHYRVFGYIISKNSNINWLEFHKNILQPLTNMVVYDKNYKTATLRYAKSSFDILDENCVSYDQKDNIEMIYSSVFGKSKAQIVPYFAKWAFVKSTLKLLRGALYILLKINK